MSRALKAKDILELSKIYEAEFNQPELHDRVLVFDVMRDGWENAIFPSTSSSFVDNTRPTSSFVETSGLNKRSKGSKPKIDSSSCDEVSKRGESDRPSSSEKAKEIHVEESEGSVLENKSISAQQITNLNIYETSRLSEAVRQRKFFVHSSWLAVQSSYFRSLFFSGMKESLCKEVHVKISEREEKAHTQLLEAFYKIDILDDVDIDELLAVLELAHKYDARFVLRKCKYILLVMKLSLQVCEKIMNVIETMTDVKDLLDSLRTFLVKEFSPLDKTWQTKSFENLSKPSLRSLLTSDELRATSENTVFHALMYWCEHNADGMPPGDSGPSLLSVVRFDQLPVDYLCNVVQHHPIATKMPSFHQLYLKGLTYHALTAEMRERAADMPVSRRRLAENIVHYTWVIQRDQFREAVIPREENKEGREQKRLRLSKGLKSDVFWWCGYKMQLFLEQITSLGDRGHGKSTVYCVTFGLQAVDLPKQSVLHLKWTSTGKVTICSGYHGQEASCTLTAEKPRSSVSARLVLTNDCGKTPRVSTDADEMDSSPTPSYSRSGFSFGSRSPIYCPTSPDYCPISPDYRFGRSTFDSETKPTLPLDLRKSGLKASEWMEGVSPTFGDLVGQTVCSRVKPFKEAVNETVSLAGEFAET